MKRILMLFPVLSLLIFSCGNQHEDLNTNRDTLKVDSNIVVDSIADLRFDKCDGLVVGEGVRLRSEANLESEIVEKLSTGDIVRMLEVSKKRVAIGSGEDFCIKNGYFWYRVQTVNNNQGWIYGKFLYSILKDPAKTVEYSDFLPEFINSRLSPPNSDWYFGLAKDNSKPVMDENGESECGIDLIPFFYQKSGKKVKPVKFLGTPDDSITMKHTSEKGWLLFNMLINLEDYIHTGFQEKGQIYLDLQREYEDYKEEFSLWIREEDGQFVGSVYFEN